MESARAAGAQVIWGPAELAAIERCLPIAASEAEVPTISRPNRIVRLIESEIIPRFMLSDQVRWCEAVDGVSRSDDATVLARNAIKSDSRALYTHIRSMLARESSHRPVVLDALASAARLLSDMRRTGLCTTSELMAGLSCLRVGLGCVGANLDQHSSS